ncbi:Metallo-hydrolase/oxidoreductase [Polychytrium aggregatum]|uniref:Metallo-hydrolase/oxidoreductase n=1 Tax=Polychytrium aggregatum TaxID=110093 RepID=UPI0022FF1572|nr:Metallo-hydrolase/oxidoreductase [Polychytrium aggregatum]KAI9207428.1 Metallo-hydrolase/oxidoreductase [Polychytrium aggregatum]
MAVDIDITFLGTASAIPSRTRSHSSLALRVDGSIWIFDAGEGTQHQLVRSDLKLGKIERIFITHLHGDHVFGLPGLLCTVSQKQGARDDAPGDGDSDAVEDGPTQNNSSSGTVIEIYGPVGTRAFVRNSLRSSCSRLPCRFRVHEFHDNPETAESSTEADLHPEELPGRNQIADSPCGSGAASLWSLDLGVFAVQVVSIAHTVPSLGYILQEESAPGNLDVASIQPHLNRNANALKAQGIRNPLSLLAKLKAGSTVTLPDQTMLVPDDFLSKPTPGRKIVILGDTHDSMAVAPVCMGATVVIHEATNACLEQDRQNGASAEEIEVKTIAHGHSTPQMAGRFARAVGAKLLILNHFSSRYKGDESPESMLVMDEIRQLALSTYLLPEDPSEPREVITARDLMTVVVPRRPKRSKS